MLRWMQSTCKCAGSWTMLEIIDAQMFILLYTSNMLIFWVFIRRPPKKRMLFGFSKMICPPLAKKIMFFGASKLTGGGMRNEKKIKSSPGILFSTTFEVAAFESATFWDAGTLRRQLLRWRHSESKLWTSFARYHHKRWTCLQFRTASVKSH